MKRILNKITILTMFVLAFACKDDSLDPFRLKELQKGSLLALRGDDGSAGNLNPDQNFFFKDNVQTTDEFHYVADFISEDQSLLQSIDVYAQVGTGTRTKVATVNASGWTIPTGGNSKQGEVRIAFSTIQSALGLSAADVAALGRTDLVLTSDILLTDGTTVPASAIVNSGLFAASAFFPAHTLNYYAEKVADFIPVASTKLASGAALKAGAKDTLFITYDQDLITPPTVAFANQTVTSALVGLTGGSVVKTADDKYYVIVTAQGTYTGGVVATVTGGQADTYGPTLTQSSKTQTINVDNTLPQRISTSTGTRVGRGQLTTITVTFNEKMSTKSANAIKISIDDPNNKIKDKDFTGSAFPASMTWASSGLSASYVFLLEEITANTAVHGPLTITFTDASDEAGNSITIPNASLTLDVGTPPAPSLTLEGITGLAGGPHDLGTTIKWSGSQGVDGINNPGGSITGTIYFVAVDAGSAAPTKVEFDQDANAIWTMATGVTSRQTGKLTTGSTGTTGTVYSAFTANNDAIGFDIYAVFVGSTGNASAIPVAPQVASVIMQ